MNPFLYSIARAYLENEPQEVSDYCFVFPNKRSGVFFHHAFARASQDLDLEALHPASTTITDFIESFAEGKKGERLEMIFILYQSYREVIYRRGGSTMGAKEIAEAVDFNKFQRWADMLLGDFNDVDMYLVDPAEIFPNLERYREISANYITPEILEEIKRHWNIDRLPLADDTFWNHIAHDGGRSADGDGEDDKRSTAVSFFRIWQVMLDIYETFRRKLSEKRLFYTGMAYREALRKIKETGAGEFRFRRYIFVGFNMLSQGEEKIFATMRDKRVYDEDATRWTPLADFYFDDASPAFALDGNTTVGFLRRYRREFPSRYDCVDKIPGFGKIEIVGLASAVGQAKIIVNIVGQLYPADGDWDRDSLRRTAIVLPKETLTQAVVSSLPSQISPVNLTMGYRLRDSRVATLVSDLVSMHLRSRKNGASGATFFYEDLLKVLTHPLVKGFFPGQCSQIIYDINVNRIYNVDIAQLVAGFPEMRPLFEYVSAQASANEIFEYFERLFGWLLECWKTVKKERKEGSGDPAEADEIQVDIDGEDTEENVRVEATAVVDRMLTRAYLTGVSRLRTLCRQYLPGDALYLQDTTVFQMLERLVGGETVSFEGRPLDGLQVMGVLEARTLDFENVLIPCMNERVFPRRHYQKSFIPPHLRSAYHMSTQEHQEAIYSYYFFRMISRARRVFLLYDARTSGVGSGQMSRYLHQLLYLYRPAQISHRIVGYEVESHKAPYIEIPKTPEIMKALEKYRQWGSGKYLSASSINQYVTCPLSFYLTYIAGYKREDEMTDYMDEGTYGTIIHGVLEDLFNLQCQSTGSRMITRAALENMMADEVNIDKALTMRINRHYLRRGENSLTPLYGDAEIFADIMKRYVILLLKREMELGDFEYIAGEFGQPMPLTIADSQGRTRTINFTYSIDRIDRLICEAYPDGILRVVDYKTGEDATEIVEVEDMFVDRNTSTHRAKAMLQLFLYAQALAQHEGIDDAIQPWIYQVRKVAVKGLTPLRISVKGKQSKENIEDYHDYVDEVNKRLIDYLDDLFSPEIPFQGAQSEKACRFCKFTEICRRNP